MFRIRRRLALSTIAASTLLVIAGCSASVPVGGVAPEWPGSGASNTLTIGVPEDLPIPDDFIADVYEASDVRLGIVPLDPAQFVAVSQKGTSKGLDLETKGLVALLGVDRDSVLRSSSTSGGATEYGEDDLCELIDKAWFSANNLEVPSGDELSAMKVEDQPEGIVWGSVLLTVRGMNNTGTDTRWVDLPGTCVSTTRNLLPLEGAEKSRTLEKFAGYLVSERGQDAIAKYGLAFPNGTQSGGTIEVQLPLADEPVTAQRP